MFEHSMALALAFLSTGTPSPQQGLRVGGELACATHKAKEDYLTWLRLRSGLKS